jgi:Mrr N-terminal domain
MSHTVSLEDDVYGGLQELAIPFEDDPNSVIRRLLLVAGTGSQMGEAAAPRAPSNGASRRVPRGVLLPQEEYEAPILTALVERQGRAGISEVLDAVGEKLSGRLTPLDHEPLRAGILRWRNRAQFARNTLVKVGEMRADSPIGIWEITDKGSQRVMGTSGGKQGS